MYTEYLTYYNFMLYLRLLSFEMLNNLTGLLFEYLLILHFFALKFPKCGMNFQC